MNDDVIKTDLLGEIIEPGVLIAFGRSGQNSREMEIGIVSRVTKSPKGGGRVYICAYDIYYNSATRTRERLIGDKHSYTIVSNQREQNHIIIIKNPYFSINNPVIARTLEIADAAMDAGLLPKNYALGVPVSELKAIEEIE